MSNNARLYQEWLDKGAHDIEVAQFLFENDHYTDIITLHIQQALEKYIKAFLIKNGWSLKRTHDLVTLAAEAHKFGLNLTQYEDVLDEINEYYIESRYPLGEPRDYSREEVHRSLEVAREVIDMITTACS